MFSVADDPIGKPAGLHVIEVTNISDPTPPTAQQMQTIYNWKSKYGGLEISEARRLKELESENAKLKRLLADAMLDQAALKDLLSKKF